MFSGGPGVICLGGIFRDGVLWSVEENNVSLTEHDCIVRLEEFSIVIYLLITNGLLQFLIIPFDRPGYNVP